MPLPGLTAMWHQSRESYRLDRSLFALSLDCWRLWTRNRKKYSDVLSQLKVMPSRAVTQNELRGVEEEMSMGIKMLSRAMARLHELENRARRGEGIECGALTIDRVSGLIVTDEATDCEKCPWA